MIDIDHFKKINDEYGHHAGDQVLREVSRLMKNCFREADTVARWGGEEFIVLLPETTKENALQVASRLLTSVSASKFSSFPGRITVSIGLAGLPGPAMDTSEKLIAASDRALYQAKAMGRNRIEAS